MNEQKIDIITNELDESQKKWATEVKQSIRNDVSKAINDANVEINWKEFELDWFRSVRYFFKNFFSNQNNMEIWKLIDGLKPWEHIVFDIKKEKNKLTQFYSEAVWIVIASWSGWDSLDEILVNFHWNKDIEPWDLVTVIHVLKDKSNPDLLHIEPQQVDYRGKLNEYYWPSNTFYYIYEVGNRKFKKIINQQN